jgi:serine/threonine protein kinase
MTKIVYENNTGDKKTLILRDSIGQGASGTVYKGLLDGFGVVAIKIIQLTKTTEPLVENDLMVRQQFGDDEDPHFILVRRVILHESMRDSLLATRYTEFVGFSLDIDPKSVAMMYKCADSVDLLDMLNIGDGYPDELLGIFFTQLCVGLKILHDRGIAHRDIKPENIMMDEGILKYIDFGFACVRDNCFKTPNLGTLTYSAPELLKRVIPIEFESFVKRDVYALGITFYVMITRAEFPVHPRKLSDISNPKLLQDSFRSIVSRKIPSKWQPLIMNMINPIEKDRYTAEQCITAIEKLFI